MFSRIKKTLTTDRNNKKKQVNIFDFFFFVVDIYDLPYTINKYVIFLLLRFRFSDLLNQNEPRNFHFNVCLCVCVYGKNYILRKLEEKELKSVLDIFIIFFSLSVI